ncbi:DUF429 domain-containing protein [Thauera humireducens]|uniref:DUF429 domain-containing protein n=1 Tax=Thauera humireducens TaxID=1134435 RepID=A0A140IEH0_9RHOO|nr:DUF429 domain-containing protein [Thauera humireducens]AMO36145.1 hypothetical protein AC731_003845 [Thauera humireducens]
MAAALTLIGVDFTSAPRPAKPITAAFGRLEGDTVVLERVEKLVDWPAFESLLMRSGPWLGAFDFPFGLPREAVVDLGWPTTWPELVRYCAHLGKTAFRAALDAYRETRPIGKRYAHRATDLPARSHSPLKLVNPPVGLMFLEGVPRLLAAGLSVPGVHAADAHRLAVEAYPGLLARSITAESYKSDDKHKQTPERRTARTRIVDAIGAGHGIAGIALHATQAQQTALIEDASGDSLDAVLALLQAAACARAGAPHYGLPPDLDPLEGWIAGA